MIRALSCMVLAALSCPPVAHAGEIASRDPVDKGAPQTWYRAESKSGLHYAWKVPKGYDGKTPRNLTVILHGTGLDWQWGPANNPVAVFRPDDIVVSVDGTSPGQGTTRLFLGEKKDADSFAAFLGEMKAGFAVESVFLYGHSQGGFFVVYFAGEHPELVSGVVADASGAWNWSRMGDLAKKIAYDDGLVTQARASGTIFKTWYGTEDERKVFEVVVEGYPSELVSKMDSWKSGARQLKIDEKALRKFASFTAWKSGWSKGLERYETPWKEWKGP